MGDGLSNRRLERRANVLASRRGCGDAVGQAAYGVLAGAGVGAAASWGWRGTGTMEGSSCPLPREPDARVQLEETEQELVGLWGHGRPQQGQPDRVGENTPTPTTPAAPLPVSEPVAGSASREAPRGGARRHEGPGAPAVSTGGTAAALPPEHPAQHRRHGFGRVWGRPPWRNVPTLGANPDPQADRAATCLGAQDVPCRGSKECLPGLLPTGQPSRWTRSDNTSPLL